MTATSTVIKLGVGVKYHLQDLKNGGEQITKIAPYNDANFYSAQHENYADSEWALMFNGYKVGTLDTLDPEEVAELLESKNDKIKAVFHND
jgi:hypothetical protein